VYRQVTLLGLATGRFSDPAARALAHDDVVSAWHDYLNRYNGGRPVVLIGHSQGSTELTSLIQEEIDGKALRARLVSALLLGGAVTTAPGQDAHGTFATIPACRAADQTGCVVAYNTYPTTPPASALFGRSTPSRAALCTNPGALGGGPALLTPYFPVDQVNAPALAPVTTPFVGLTDAVTAECRSTSTAGWLQATASAPREAPLLRETLGPAWGLHRIDVTVALGDLVELVGRQAAAFPNPA